MEKIQINDQKLNPKSDPNLWLEDVLSEKALAWAKHESDLCIQRLSQFEKFKEFESKALEILQSQDKIAMVHPSGAYAYNLWQDENHIQGIYRRALLTDYVAQNPKWETLIDLDELSGQENEKWVFSNMSLSDDESLALVRLSPGGSDSTVTREFNMITKTFVKDGFFLPRAKAALTFWIIIQLGLLEQIRRIQIAKHCRVTLVMFTNSKGVKLCPWLKKS